jgi:hypothetical protein
MFTYQWLNEEKGSWIILGGVYHSWADADSAMKRKIRILPGRFRVAKYVFEKAYEEFWGA